MTLSTSWLILKITLLVITIYVGTAYSFWLFNPPKYIYRSYNFFVDQATIIAQPVMEILANSKVSHSFHFKNISSEEIDSGVEPLFVRSTKPQVRSFKPGLKSLLKNAQADLGGATESAIVEPVNYNDKWSLVFCDLEGQNCQESNFLHSAKVKILVDGQQKLWGKTVDGKFIRLQLKEYLDRNQELSTLFI